jgi:hypothetical protein
VSKIPTSPSGLRRAGRVRLSKCEPNRLAGRSSVRLQRSEGRFFQN